jgi:hypothetical protein
LVARGASPWMEGQKKFGFQPRRGGMLEVGNGYWEPTHLFEARDTIESRKDGLLEEIEARLRQSVQEEMLFVVQWFLC